MPNTLLQQAQEEIGTTKNAKMTVPLIPRPVTYIQVDDTIAMPSTDKILNYKVR